MKEEYFDTVEKGAEIGVIILTFPLWLIGKLWEFLER